MATRTTKTTCSRRFGRGTCKTGAAFMADGQLYCAEHVPSRDSGKDVQPISAGKVKDEGPLPKCACGCGVEVTRRGRQFRQGHDMRLRSKLLAAWDAGQGAMAEELVERGWYSWAELEDRAAKREAKAAKKAAA